MIEKTDGVAYVSDNPPPNLNNALVPQAEYSIISFLRNEYVPLCSVLRL